MLGLEPKPKHPAAWKPSSPRSSEKGNNLHKAVIVKRANFFLKNICLQGTEEHWGKKTKLQVI